MSNPNDTNIIVDGQKVVATLAQSGTVVEDGGAIDATSVIQTDSGLQKVVKVMDINGGGGGGGEQNIKAYHAPSATLDQTLQVIIPNVDAVTEQGLYNVDYTFDMDGAEIKGNAILQVSTTKAGEIIADTVQNITLYLGESYVFATRSFQDDSWTSWAGQNIPVELAKCLQNKASGTDSISLIDNTTENGSYSLGKLLNPSIPIPLGGIGVGYGYYVNGQNAIAIGRKTRSANSNSVAIGFGAYAQGSYSTAIGSCSTTTTDLNFSPSSNNVAYAGGVHSIQLGIGYNNVAKQFQVYEYPMLDGNTGKIPSARLDLKHRYCLIGSGSGNIGNINGTILPWQTENKPFVFEVDFRVAPLGNFTNGQGILLTGNSHYSIGFELVLDGENSSTNDNKARIGCGLTTANNSWNITWSWSDYVFEPMGWYTFRLSYDLTKYTLEFKKKGDIAWTQLGQFANSTKLYYASNSNIYIGAQSSNSNITPLWKGALVDINSFKATNGNEIYFNGLDSLAHYLTLNTLNISEFYEP